jgi:hypothetical protein
MPKILRFLSILFLASSDIGLRQLSNPSVFVPLMLIELRLVNLMEARPVFYRVNQ